MTAAMEKQGECEDAAKEKDSRYKEDDRAQQSLHMRLRNKGDQATADKYSEQDGRAQRRAGRDRPRSAPGTASEAKALAKDPREQQKIAEEGNKTASTKEKNPNKKTATRGPNPQVLLENH